MQVKYLFFDIETTGYTPSTAELISIAVYATDANHNIIDEFYEECTVGSKRFIQNVCGHTVDLWPDQATEVHGITFEQQLKFQEPIDLYRKLYKFLEQWPDDSITWVYHSNTNFDMSFLTYRSDIHAPVFYRYLLKRFSTFEYSIEHGEHINGIKSENTLHMARQLRKSGADIFKQAAKLEKQIAKFNGYLTKERKTPAKPAKIKEWNDKLQEAKNALESLSVPTVQLEKVSLDYLCEVLDIPLNHHDARSDAKALIPIHKFLKENM